MSPWFQVEKKPRERPEWLAPAIWQDTTGIFRCQLLGIQYRFAVTRYTQPFVDLILGKPDPWASLTKRERRSDSQRARVGERGIQDILSALLCKVRETEVDSAAQMLGQEIRDKLEPLLTMKIHENIARLSTSSASLPGMGPGIILVEEDNK